MSDEDWQKAYALVRIIEGTAQQMQFRWLHDLAIQELQSMKPTPEEEEE